MSEPELAEPIKQHPFRIFTIGEEPDLIGGALTADQAVTLAAAAAVRGAPVQVFDDADVLIAQLGD